MYNKHMSTNNHPLPLTGGQSGEVLFHPVLYDGRLTQPSSSVSFIKRISFFTPALKHGEVFILTLTLRQSRRENTTFGTVQTTNLFLFNFRASVSSINQILNQMCEDRQSEEVRSVNLHDQHTGWFLYVVDSSLQRVGTRKRKMIRCCEPTKSMEQHFIADRRPVTQFGMYTETETQLS